MQKKLFQTIVKISLLALIYGFSFFSNQPVRAGTLLDVSDTMTRLKINTNADHTIKFNLPAGVDFDATDNEDMINIGFDEDSNAFVVGGSFTADDFTLTDGTTDYVIDSVIQGDFPQIPDCTGVVGENKVRVGVENDTDIFRFRACLGDGFTASEVDLTITIKGTAPNGTFTNPNTAGSKKNAIALEDEGVINAYYTYFAVSIVDDDQVTVTATVDPTLTFDIDTAVTDRETPPPYEVDLNSIPPDDVATSNGSTINSIWIDLTTNASGGGVITVQDEGNGVSPGLYNVSGDYLIPSVTDTLVGGTDGYGICAKDWSWISGSFGALFPYNGINCRYDGHQVGAVELTPTNILSSDGGPVEGGRAEILVKAAASPITPAGTYVDTITFIATGTF